MRHPPYGLSTRSLSEAATHARALAEVHGLTFIHPYDDAHVIAGQGTIALEFIGDHPHLDCLVIPIGGGGLISGMAIAAKALKPDIQIYGVQATAYPAMANLFHGTNGSHASQTIAEGIGVKEPGLLTREIVKRHVMEIFLVEEHQIESALAQLLEVEKVLVEGAAAAGFAAVVANPAIFAGKKVGLVLSGGNIDMRLLANVVMRELTREGRIQSLAFDIEDRPGTLARITHLVSEAGGNILDVHHERLSTQLSAKSATLGLTLEARDPVHAMEIRQRLAREGFASKAEENSGR
jgi:threonine dehydratase